MEEQRIEKSNRNKELTLMGLFGCEALENLEKRLAEATDFSFSIIDYKGRQIVKDYNQNAYEEYLKRTGEDSSCQMQAAFAAAKSAITNVPYIYLCRCGLIKVAVPIVLKDQYLGAIICGFIRCDDLDYEDPITKTKVIERDFSLDHDHSEDRYFNQIPIFKAQKIQAIANLVFYMVKELCLKENYALQMGNEEHNQIHMQVIRRKNEELKAQVKKLQEMTMKANMFPQTLLNMMVTISSIAIVEDATMTQDIVALLSAILRYYIEYHKSHISLQQELDQIENYFKILKIRYENRVEIDMNWPEEAKEQRIPKLILLPLVEYIVNFGIFNQSFKGIIHSKVEFITDRCLITFSLESNDFIDSMAYLKESGNVINDRLLNEQLSTLERRISLEYGEDYNLKIEPNLVVLDIPKN